MPQNRNKLIELFIGNISNSVVHKILEKAVEKDKEEHLIGRYRKELLTSFEVAKKYRDKINPVNMPLPERDINYIREKIIRKVEAELKIRILRGYKNINLGLVEEEVNKILIKMNVA